MLQVVFKNVLKTSNRVVFDSLSHIYCFSEIDWSLCRPILRRPREAKAVTANDLGRFSFLCQRMIPDLFRAQHFGRSSHFYQRRFPLYFREVFFSKFFYLKHIVFIPKQDNFFFEWSQSVLSTAFCFVDFQCLCLYYGRVFSSLWDISKMLKSIHSVFPIKPITWHEWKNTWSAGQRHLTHKRQQALSYSIVSHFMQLSEHVFVWILTFRCFYVIYSLVTSVSTEAPLLGLAIFIY